MRKVQHISTVFTSSGMQHFRNSSLGLEKLMPRTPPIGGTSMLPLGAFAVDQPAGFAAGIFAVDGITHGCLRAFPLVAGTHAAPAAVGSG